MTVGIVRTMWSGTSGGPGLTQFVISAAGGTDWSVANAAAAVQAVRTFWNSQAALLPNEVSLAVHPTVDQYDEITGLLVGTTTSNVVPSSVIGTSASQYAAGAGYRYNWRTGAINNGRRVNGRTYVVPAAVGVYDTDGTITATTMTNCNGYATTLLSSLASSGLALMVWGRPKIQGQPGGYLFGVSSGDVADKTAVLRTRRD